jgi:DNA-directed RNA polymerase subunit E'/Rpb7
MSSDNELINPFIIKQLATRVELYPHQMDSELYLNLKMNLKKSLEGKCNKYGFVYKIIRIENYEDNIINPENFSGNAVYNIHYIANICVPLVGSTIITCVEEFNKRLLLGKNGPINAIIKITDLNDDVFTVKPDGSIWIENISRLLQRGDYIKVFITGRRFSPGDDKIGVMGNVIDIASEEEVEEFFTFNIKDEDINVSKQIQQVEFNEDADYNANLDDKKGSVEIKTNMSEI